MFEKHWLRMVERRDLSETARKVLLVVSTLRDVQALAGHVNSDDEQVHGDGCRSTSEVGGRNLELGEDDGRTGVCPIKKVDSYSAHDFSCFLIAH
jgi:hypothetical protein